MDPLKKIVELLESDSPRKRIAAAVVIGELNVKDPAVVSRLITMAKDPLEAYAEAAIEALGAMKAIKGLPVMLDALGRGKGLQELASKAIADIGEEALPVLRERIDSATPEARIVLSSLLPKVGSKQSFEMALDGMLGQPFEAVNRIALSMRQEAKAASEGERKVMRTQVEKFLEKKKVLADESATRGAVKVLGWLELRDTEETLYGFLNKKHLPLVRVDATAALRFALGEDPSKKGIRKLIELLDDQDALVIRAARDTLTVLKIGPAFADELAELCNAADGQVALWAISRLGELADHSKLAAKTLQPVARGGDRARADAAAKVLARLPGGQQMLVEALADAEEENGATVLAEVLATTGTVTKKDVKRLIDAADKQLGKSFAVAKRQLEPVRSADPEAWGELLRDKAKALLKKDPARAEAIGQLLGRSSVATSDDRFILAAQQLLRGSLDPHPKARQRDPALTELEKLQAEGFALSQALQKDKKLSDEARYYVGVHFAEKPTFELKNLGAEVLEALAAKGKTKLAKAAKNKLKLLEL
ncbi:MAG: HEAT repeat domain-containing protein [Myxococcaceae bacterium]